MLVTEGKDGFFQPARGDPLRKLKNGLGPATSIVISRLFRIGFDLWLRIRFLLSFGLYGAILFKPGVPPALECVDGLVSFVEKLLRRTGASRFGWSATIDDDLLIPRQLIHARFDLVNRDSHRPLYLLVATLPGAFTA